MPDPDIARRTITLIQVSVSCVFIAAFTDTAFIVVTSTMHPKPHAVAPLALETPDANFCMYSPNTRQMIAREAGRVTNTFVQQNMKDKRSPTSAPHSRNVPYASLRYACSPPALGIAVPSSAYDKAPVRARLPDIIHADNAKPRLGENLSTSPGNANMPDPIMTPTMMATPLQRPRVFSSLLFPFGAPAEEDEEGLSWSSFFPLPSS